MASARQGINRQILSINSIINKTYAALRLHKYMSGPLGSLKEPVQPSAVLYFFVTNGKKIDLEAPVMRS